MALLLLAILSVAGLRGLTRLRDHWGTVGAREAMAGLIREARSRAVARGGARLVLTAPTALAVLEAGGVTLRVVDLRADFGVDLDLGGAATVDLHMDAAGVGRMSARTLVFARGAARSRLVVSGYGRVRR